MASPAAAPDSVPVPPAADPASIRATLSPALLAIFDREWDAVLEEAKKTKELATIRSMLQNWQFIAYDEMRDPGSYFRLQAKAELISRTGSNPDARTTVEEMRAQIRQRLEG
ncbi:MULTISPECIES: DUF6247 family protein [unclassified Nocardia]|uniref:DUF6247 family protein n=1 Tax=unclassified Nocardia TaxID=2637762 RepID=UPI001CE45CEA|nr:MULTISPECIES: DUF6247 family protein [unclassified Nocardia]